MKRTLLYILLFLITLTVNGQWRKELKWSNVMANGTANKYAGWDASGNPVEKDAPSGSGVTNTALNNELPKSDGTNLISSSFFVTGTNPKRIYASGNVDFYWGDITLTTGIGATIGVKGISASNAATQAGNVVLYGGESSLAGVQGGNVLIRGGLNSASGLPGNISLGSETPSFGNGAVVIFIPNANTVPSINPTGGGILYVEGGALKYRSPGGTVTTIAPN